MVEDSEAKVSCTVTKSNPLPTFSWQYAFKNLECDIQQPTGTCVPKENKWITVPSQLVSPSSSTPTNESIVNVAKDQQNAFYRCQAFNSLGNDSQILRFVRFGKNISFSKNNHFFEILNFFYVLRTSTVKRTDFLLIGQATIMDKSLGALLHFWGVFQFTQVEPLPSPHKQRWTRISRIFSEFQLCIGWGRENCKKKD